MVINGLESAGNLNDDTEKTGVQRQCAMHITMSSLHTASSLSPTAMKGAPEKNLCNPYRKKKKATMSEICKKPTRVPFLLLCTLCLKSPSLQLHGYRARHELFASQSTKPSPSRAVEHWFAYDDFFSGPASNDTIFSHGGDRTVPSYRCLASNLRIVS